MKRGLKIFISIITVIMVFCCTVLIDYQKAYAIGLSDLDFFYDLITNEDAPYSMYREAIYKSITSDMGLIVGNLTEWQIENERKIVAKYLKKKYGTEKTAEEVTDEEVRSFYNDYRQNITVNRDNHSITYNDNSRLVLNTIADTFKAEQGYFYAYTFNCDLSLTSFRKGPQAQALKSIVQQYQDDYYVTETYNSNNGELTINCFPKGNVYFVKTSEGEHVTYKTDWTNGNTSNPSAFGGFGKRIKADGSTYDHNYKDMHTEHYTTQSNATFNGDQAHWVKLCSSGQVFTYKVFNNVNSLKAYDIGQAPYYINNSVNTSWKNSTGDYVVTTDNSNHANYGDVTTYINNYYTEHNKNPNDDEINIYIENTPAPTPEPTPTPSPDNPSGGGSGSNSSVSGNSGGNASATATANGGSATASNGGVNVTNNNNPVINFIFGGSDTVSGNDTGTVSGNNTGGSGINFGFLGSLGSTLKSLIENIGKAIVDVITGITTVLAEVIENVPKVFGDFIGAILNWLPPELQALISLSVVAMVTYGIIKLIRG